MARRGDYLFRRPGSANWYLKLQYPGTMIITAEWVLGYKPKRERSLYTPDRRQAEAIAAPFIAKHKQIVVAHAAISRSRRRWGKGVVVREIEPGTKIDHPDGGYTVATENDIMTVGPDQSIKTRPNLFYPAIEVLEPNVPKERLPEFMEAVEAQAKHASFKDVDSAILDNYLTKKKRPPDEANQARITLRKFKDVTGSTFATVTDEEVVTFIEALQSSGSRTGGPLSPGSVQRRVAALKAACNLEVRRRVGARLKSNPFAFLQIDGADETEGRDPYTEADVEKVRENLELLDGEERLMWTWHIASGIRPGGIYSIQSDHWEEAEHPETGQIVRTRHVRIRKDKENRGGKKYGPRNLPIPQAVLDAKHPDGTPLLPDRIEGRLFERPLKPMLVTLNKKLKKMGVNGVRKSFYSGRDRATDRLTNRNVPKDQRAAILGHARTDIEARYGHGFLMCVLKPSIDKIGA